MRRVFLFLGIVLSFPCSLYHEQIDLGEEKPRSVVSGLVKHIALDDFIGKHVLVLTNLKPAKMRGVLSEGMVLCASTAESLEVLSPPAGAVVGERLNVEGEEGEADDILNPKKKVWDTIRDSGVCRDAFVICDSSHGFVCLLWIGFHSVSIRRGRL